MRDIDQEKTRVIRAMIYRGAEINVPNNEGKTAQMMVNEIDGPATRAEVAGYL